MTFDTTPVPVPVGDCRCPGSPHEDGDVVYLAPFLSMAGGMAAQVAIAEGATDLIRLQELLARVYLTHCVVDWTFVDDEGQRVGLDQIERLLPYGKGGRLVADRADDLYAQDVLLPFKQRVERAMRSAAGSTKRPRVTSARRTSTATPQ